MEKTMLACFSGGIASGKTYVSKKVAQHFGWRWTSFSTYLTHQVRSGSCQDVSRRHLQELGQRRIINDPRGFCTEVLAAGGFIRGESFVLDGVRHAVAVERLSDIAVPADVRLFFLDAPNQVLRQRAELRSGKDGGNFDRAVAHSVESESAKLRDVADWIIDGSVPKDVVVAHCVRLIDCWFADTRCRPDPDVGFGGSSEQEV